MGARALRLTVIGVLISAGISTSDASVETDLDAFNRKIYEQLRATAPDAEPIFEQADEARLAGDHRRAAALYAQVVAKAPLFVHAVRRLGMEQAVLGERTEAIATLERATTIEESSENLTALASALVQATPDSLITFSDAQRASQLSARALILDPHNLYAYLVRATLALHNQDLPQLDATVAALDTLAPREVSTHYYGSVAAASHGDFKRARAELDSARADGMPEESYRGMLASLEHAEPHLPRFIFWGGVIAGAWIASGLAFFLLGLCMSALTLRTSERVPSTPEVLSTGLDTFVRGAYRVVLWLCCAYYYASMPILLALVLVIGGGLIYGLLRIGHVPIKLLLIIGFATVVTAWAILKSLLVRATESDPGVPLDLEHEPALRRTLEEVAGRVGVHPVDKVFLTPTTEVAVFERGGVLRQLRGRGESCLILGAGVLDGFRVGPFRAVLAHEYGHLSNRDTAGGDFALAVRRSVVALAIRLAQSGAAGWYNPAWLFVNGFHRLFLHISQGASRLQEVLADRWAATLYGAQAFEAGLRHVIERAIEFDAHVGATLKEVVDSKRPLANLYQYSPQSKASAEDIAAGVRNAIDRKPSPYDSHPRPADRFRWVHALGASSQAAADDDAPVWDLFSNRTAIEELMTNQVRMAVAQNHGIEIAAEA